VAKENISNRAEYPLPELLLLDLKMPKLDGFEVLRWLRQDPGLKALRVVVLTSSEEISDVNRAYQLGANSFLVKPVNFDHLVEISQAIKGYWLWLSKVPEAFRSDAAEGPARKVKRELPILERTRIALSWGCIIAGVRF